MNDTIDPLKVFKQFLSDTGISPTTAVLLAKAVSLEAEAKRIHADKPTDLLGRPII
ncbi:hypothetical protein [Trichlorobacter lovleyi]|uniref:hypothetical protein n=1 Tax=Trichlorobacter lovleyi TaxID=313985 RepID=UPI003D145306